MTMRSEVSGARSKLETADLEERSELYRIAELIWAPETLLREVGQ